ncbi:MAG: response regulator [Enterocloster asparagiformis]|nr:response regulator [Enterocloster asparagiformis]
MRNILIISSNAQICRQITDILRQAGYSHIYTAADSRQAFPMIYRLNPKLIVADLELPPDEFNDLQKTISGPLMQIILFITPHLHVDETVLRLNQHGYSHFVIRPIDSRLFLNAVREIVDSNG